MRDTTRSIMRRLFGWLTLAWCLWLAYHATVPVMQAQAKIIEDRWALRRDIWARAVRDRATAITNLAAVGVGLWTAQAIGKLAWPLASRAAIAWKNRPRWRRAYLHFHHKPPKPKATRSNALEL